MDFRELENMVMGKKACLVGWSSVWSCPKVLVLKRRKKGDGIWERNRAMLHDPVRFLGLCLLLCVSHLVNV